jgi:pimeloyl-ACP methyl ester carboxylesterase
MFPESAVTHRMIATNGIQMHIAEQGTGPLVVLLHGFPETWRSWRQQMAALAGAGYHAVAPDMRGYGQTDAPAAVDAYTILHLVGDVVGLLDALETEQAVVVGHDWGALVAWQMALLRPDRVRALSTLSVPYSPRGPAHGPRSAMPPTAIFRQMVGDHFFYQLYFQEPGLAEAELERDIPQTIRMMLVGLSGDATPAERWHPIHPSPQATLFTDATPPMALPAWLTEADIAQTAGEFARTGFRGGLNWYRNMDRNWELAAAYTRVRIQPPTLFLWGDRDPIYEVAAVRAQVARLGEAVLHLQSMRFDGCGHWVQQERAAETNTALLAFLAQHPA